MRITAVLILFSVLFLSCEKKSCQNVTCPGANSTCVDGQCYCLPGYEGDYCDQYSYLKYIGSYQVSESCTTTFSGYLNQQYSASISQGFSLDIITISNFANRGLPVDATIISANFLTIYEQNVGAVDVSGGEGNYKPFNNQIQFDYNYSAGGNFHQCTAIFFH